MTIKEFQKKHDFDNDDIEKIKTICVLFNGKVDEIALSGMLTIDIRRRKREETRNQRPSSESSEESNERNVYKAKSFSRKISQLKKVGSWFDYHGKREY